MCCLTKFQHSCPPNYRAPFLWKRLQCFSNTFSQYFTASKCRNDFCWTALFLTLAFFLLSAVSADTAAMQHVAATNAHTASVELPEVTEQVKRYSNLCYLLYFVSFAYGLVIRIAFLQSGLNSLIRNRAENASLNPVFQFLVYYVRLYAVMSLLMLPLSIYSGFVIEHQFNLSEQSFQGWSPRLRQGHCDQLSICRSNSGRLLLASAQI